MYGGSMSKVLVVGGAGYVGGWLTDQLLIYGHDVRVIDNLSYEDMYLKDVEFFYGDINSFNTIESHLSWADVVVWLSALVGDPACAINPKLTFETNVDSVKMLTKKFTGRIIFLSTCSVYGAQNLILSEESQTSPMSLYAESKLIAESILLEAKNEVLIFRLGTLFGVGDSYSRLRFDLVLNSLTAKAVTEKTMSVFGGQQFRPLLHVRDVATAIVPQVDSNNKGIFNLHTENLTILELAQRIQKILPDSIIETTDISFQDLRNYQVSSKKANKLLNFSPKYSIESGIKEIVNLIVTKRIRDVRIPKFNNYEILKSSLNGGIK
jgi:nucleoside-diphosphate-sugar epimerase